MSHVYILLTFILLQRLKCFTSHVRNLTIAIQIAASNDDNDNLEAAPVGSGAGTETLFTCV